MNSALAVERKMKNTKLTDEQVFCSPAYASYMRLMLRHQCKRIRRNPPRITIANEPWNDAVAHIAGSDMYINFGHPRVHAFAKNRLQYARLINGLAVHEFGHYRFTDCAGYEMAGSRIFGDGRWFPALPELEDMLEMNRLDFECFLKDNPGRIPACHKAWHSIGNTLEDAYIEESLYHVMSGVLLDGLNYLRYQQRKNAAPFHVLLEAWRDGKIDMFSTVSDMMLTYAKFGVLKCDWANKDESKSEPMMEFRKVRPYIDQMLNEASIVKRLTGVNLIFLSLWPYIRERIEGAEDTEEAGAPSYMSEGIASSAPSSGSGGRMMPTPVSEDEDTGASGSRKSRSKTKRELEKSEPSPGKDEDSTAPDADEEKEDLSSDGSGDEKETDADDKPGEDDPGASDDSEETDETMTETDDDEGEEPDSGAESGDEDSEDSSPEADGDGDIEVEEEAEKSKPTDADTSGDPGEVEIREDEGFFSDEEAEEDFDASEILASIRSLETDIKRHIAIDEVNDELIAELNDEANGLSYGEAHKGVPITTFRVKSVSDKAKETFDAVYAPIKPVVDEMVRRVAPMLKKKTNEEFVPMSGFFSGSKFDASRLVLNDWRNFKNNVCPIPDRETAVTVLVDESGSMNGDRIKMARLAAISLYMFCYELSIKCSVIGHTESFSAPRDLQLQIYSDFESPDKLDKYRLLGISARDNNRDGAALCFAGNHLLKRPEANKLLFVISDGAPEAYRYSGLAAATDLANTVAELRRRGIIIFAAAIGSDKDDIHRIFGSGFLDISDIGSLPAQLLFWLRRYLK